MTRARNVLVRPERPDDHPAVFELNLHTFQRPLEAQLVERLRPSVRPLVSLVAVADKQIVGHVIITPARVDGPVRRLAMGIGPMAVHPDWRRRGVGSRLLQVGIDACRIAAVEVLFVVGEPAYYRRFGFRPAHPLGLVFRYAEGAYPLLAAEISAGALDGLRGTVHYPPLPAGVEAAAAPR